MKIIIVGTAYPYRGGLSAFNERLAIQFQEEGHQVEIYTFTLQYPNFLFPGKTQYSTEDAPLGLRIQRKINSCNPFNWLKVGREIRQKNADLVIFCYWMSFFAPCYGIIARIIGLTNKRIALIHNMMPHEPSLLDKLFPSFFVNSMDGFVTMTEAVKKDVMLLDKHQKPKCISPHPMYDHYGDRVSRTSAAAILQLKEETHYMLFFGLIRDYKGLDWLLQALGDDRLIHLNIKLIVAGEFYNDAKQYYNLESQYGLQGRIIWNSQFIPDDQIKYLFSIADIVVQPYKTATQSGVTQIAYYFNTPMLVTNVGGLAEIVPNGKVGYAVEPTPKAIADALVDFYENNRQQDFQQGIADEKAKYEWDKMTETILTCAGK